MSKLNPEPHRVQGCPVPDVVQGKSQNYISKFKINIQAQNSKRKRQNYNLKRKAKPSSF